MHEIFTCCCRVGLVQLPWTTMLRKVREFYAEFTAMVVIATPLLVHEQRGACLARACLEVLVDSRGRPPEMLDSVFATFASRESRMPHETMGSGAVCRSNFSKAHRMHSLKSCGKD